MNLRLCLDDLTIGGSDQNALYSQLPASLNPIPFCAVQAWTENECLATDVAATNGMDPRVMCLF